MLGIKKPLKILDPHNYKHAVRARGCLPKRQEGKGNEDMYHFFNIHGAVKGVLHCRESSSLQITHTSGQEGSQGVTLIQQRQPWGCSRSPQDVTQAQPSKTGPRIPNQERRMTANATQWSSLASRGWNNSSVQEEGTCPGEHLTWGKGSWGKRQIWCNSNEQVKKILLQRRNWNAAKPTSSTQRCLSVHLKRSALPMLISRRQSQQSVKSKGNPGIYNRASRQIFLLGTPITHLFPPAEGWSQFIPRRSPMHVKKQNRHF